MLRFVLRNRKKMVLMVFFILFVRGINLIDAFGPSISKKLPTHIGRYYDFHSNRSRIGFPASNHIPLRLETALRNSPALETFSAAGSIALSTAIGMVADRTRILRGAGTMVTILVAAHLSNLNLSPRSHFLYDLCWTKFLPASLALLLLSPSSPEDERDGAIGKSSREVAREEIGAVSIPFIIGCMGSAIGCLVSFFICLLGRNNSERVHTHILLGRKHFFWLPGHLLLSPTEAAVAAGCLCASYIGGSVNFFATARIVAIAADIPDQDGAASMLGGMFGSSASDLLVMALYFSTVTASLSSSVMHRWFPGREPGKTEEEKRDLTRAAAKMSLVTSESSSSMNGAYSEQAEHMIQPSWRKKVLAALTMLPMAWAIVEISDACELITQLPGMGSACIAVLGSLISKILPKLLSSCDPRQLFKKHGATTPTERPIAFLGDINSVTSRMSDICFYMLFAAIGSSANLADAVRNGGWHSSSSFIFAALALAVHILVIIGGSFCISRAFPRFRFFPLGIDEIIVASNAAIGGPVTAAAVAAGMAAEEEFSLSKRKGLILAATFYGVVGYGIATFVGVAMSRLLLNLIGAS